MRQLPERMLKKFQDHRKSWPQDINFQYILLPPIFPLSEIQTNYARKESFEEIRKRREKLRNSSGEPEEGWGSWCHGWRLTGDGFTELLSFPQSFASTTRQPGTAALLGKSCHGQHQCLGCPQVLLSRSGRVQVPSGPGTSWPMNFMTSWPLIPRLSHRLLSKVTRGDHRTPSFEQKFMEHTACIEMYRPQHGNQRKYEQRWVRKEERGIRVTKLTNSHFPSWSTIVRKAFVYLFSCGINRLKSFTNPYYTGANSGVMDWSKQKKGHIKEAYLILGCFQQVPAAYYENIIRKFYSFTSIRLKILPPYSSPSNN